MKIQRQSDQFGTGPKPRLARLAGNALGFNKKADGEIGDEDQFLGDIAEDDFDADVQLEGESEFDFDESELEEVAEEDLPPELREAAVSWKMSRLFRTAAKWKKVRGKDVWNMKLDDGSSAVWDSRQGHDVVHVERPDGTAYKINKSEGKTITDTIRDTAASGDWSSHTALPSKPSVGTPAETAAPKPKYYSDSSSFGGQLPNGGHFVALYDDDGKTIESLMIGASQGEMTMGNTGRRVVLDPPVPKRDGTKMIKQLMEDWSSSGNEVKALNSKDMSAEQLQGLAREFLDSNPEKTHQAAFSTYVSEKYDIPLQVAKGDRNTAGYGFWDVEEIAAGRKSDGTTLSDITGPTAANLNEYKLMGTMPESVQATFSELGFTVPDSSATPPVPNATPDTPVIDSPDDNEDVQLPAGGWEETGPGNWQLYVAPEGGWTGAEGEGGTYDITEEDGQFYVTYFGEGDVMRGTDLGEFSSLEEAKATGSSHAVERGTLEPGGSEKYYDEEEDAWEGESGSVMDEVGGNGEWETFGMGMGGLLGEGQLRQMPDGTVQVIAPSEVDADGNALPDGETMYVFETYDSMDDFDNGNAADTSKVYPTKDEALGAAGGTTSEDGAEGSSESGGYTIEEGTNVFGVPEFVVRDGEGNYKGVFQTREQAEAVVDVRENGGDMEEAMKPFAGDEYEGDGSDYDEDGADEAEETYRQLEKEDSEPSKTPKDLSKGTPAGLSVGDRVKGTNSDGEEVEGEITGFSFGKPTVDGRVVNNPQKVSAYAGVSTEEIRSSLDRVFAGKMNRTASAVADELLRELEARGESY